MAKPFPTTFDQDGQLNSPSAASSPISYQANVNRQKTKKWVDAKAANYGGDDWGDDDDEYDEPPPPPISKASGGSQNPLHNSVSSANDYKKSYGDLPPRPRANSFDEDDERRNFSNSTGVAQSEPPPAQISHPFDRTGQESSQVVPNSINNPPSNIRQGSTSIGVLENSAPSAFPDAELGRNTRRDHSPAPLTGPVAFATSNNLGEPPAGKFPARKSSLSQTNAPNLSDIIQPTQESQATEVSSPPAGPSKPIHFIRPADIYRQAEERRRQSQDSNSRPSLETLANTRPGDSADLPGKQTIGERKSSDSLNSRRQGAERDASPGGRYLAPVLEPVKERKSEYGFDGFNVNKYTPEGITSQPVQPLSESTKLDVHQSRRNSTSPKLPDLNRMSGFGMDMFLPKQGTDAVTVKPSFIHEPTVDGHPTGSSISNFNESTSVRKETSIEPANSADSQSSLFGNTAKAKEDQQVVEKELLPSKPLSHATSEQSFRPNLPGSWSSYATTERTETPKPERGHEFANQSSQHADNDAEDLTPTTIKHALPQTESTAHLQGFESGLVRGQHDEQHGLPNSATRDAMPTPDLMMAPSGSLYSVTAPDPRLLPEIEQSKPIEQPRPEALQRDPSSESSDEPPPPPAKDSPEIISKHAKDNNTVHEGKQERHQGSEVPVLTHPSKSEQDENDRLEEEIVRRLSPQPREGPTHEGTLLKPSAGQPTRESTYLPSEYGDYWASSADESQPVSLHQDTQESLGKEVLQSPPGDREHVIETEHESIAPLSVAKTEPPLAVTPERPSIKQRFSWEQSSENVSSVKVDKESEVLPPLPLAASDRAASSHVNDPPSQVFPMESPDNRQPQDTEKIVANSGELSANSQSVEGQHRSPNAAVIGGAAAVDTGAILVGAATDNLVGQPQRRLSLAEEKATRVSSYPVNVTPPESEHPARSPEPYFTSGAEQIGHPPSTNSPIASPIAPLPPASSSRLLAFKEILNMKSSHERRQTFDETRQRFAAMDSGLSSWMEMLRAQHPEHHNATGFWTSELQTAHAPRPAKTGGGQSGFQQPYYQQYLNASSPTNPSTPTSTPGPSGSAAYQQQGFPPSSGSSSNKITTQQVQAKGKEFLHTAGVFGGKAGKAGKGLLAKGKSKFRGSGGDKTPNETTLKEPKPKNDNRSSWSLGLSKTKSNGPPSAQSLAQETSPIPKSTASDTRTTTMTSISPQPQDTTLSNNNNTYGTRAGHIIAHSQASAGNSFSNNEQQNQSELIASVREIRDADDSTTESSVKDNSDDRVRSEDYLAPPRPIGKHQPSWDPFNATPIAEEQGSAYDTAPNQRSYPFPTSNTLTQETSLSRPGEWATTKPPSSESAPPTPDNQRDMRQQPANTDSETIAAAESSIKPPSGIMHRPRGSNSNYRISPDATEDKLASSPARTNEAVQRFADVEQQTPLTVSEQDSIQTDSSFLPPIRRTSTFGFKFGSRQAKQRFPIDDEDDHEQIALTSTNANGSLRDHSPTPGPETQVDRLLSVDYDHIPLRHKRRSLQQLKQEDSGYSTDQAFHDRDGAGSLTYISGPPRPVLSLNASATHKPADELSSLDQSQSQRQSIETARPILVHNSSSDYSQRSVGPSRPHSDATITRHTEASQIGDSRLSQDAWKPNAAAMGTASPPPQNVPTPTFSARQSWDAPRRNSGSGGSLIGDRPWGQQQSRLFEQPPSSAQRYPELFKNTSSNLDSYEKENGELPAHYYQQPLSREATFLPRQQTNEYQLPGVGPPDDEPRSNSRRNSSFLKDIGGRISRATSRERRKSISQDDEFDSIRERGTPQRRNDEDSDIMSLEDKEKKKRRSSFFLGLGKSSAGTEAFNAREKNAFGAQPENEVFRRPSVSSNMVMKPSGAPQGRKKGFFGGGNSPAHDIKPRESSPASILNAAEVTSAKKKRFSGLGALLTSKSEARRGSTPDRFQQTSTSSQPPGALSQSQDTTQNTPTESNYVCRQPKSTSENQPHRDQLSAQPPLLRLSGSPASLINSKNQPPPIQNVDNPRNTRAEESNPGKLSKARRISAAGLFGGILGRKQSHQDNKGLEAHPSDHNGAHRTPPARTYSDLNDYRDNMEFSSSSMSNYRAQPPTQTTSADRGRSTHREPQYNSVPIPKGYSLVHAQGSHSVATEYDPRGIRKQQAIAHPWAISEDLRTRESDLQNRHTLSSRQDDHHPYIESRVTEPFHGDQSHSERPFGGSTFSANQNKPNHPPSKVISQEDILARSPALPTPGQQRPYQISLPGENNEKSTKPNHGSASPFRSTSRSQDDDVASSLPSSSHPPQIRYPGSPWTYPLPEDTPFSPINPAAEDLAPPPPPKDYRPAQIAMPSHSPQFSNTSNLTNAELNRSGTHRTAISAISGVSDSFNDRSHATELQQGGSSDNLIKISSHPERTFNDRHDGFLSPSPPSPVGTPQIGSPSEGLDRAQDTKTTILEAPRRQSLDLYDASPLGRPASHGHSRQLSGPTTPRLTIQTSLDAPRGHASSASEAGMSNGGHRKMAELEGTKADGVNMRIPSQPPEEKIFYDAQSGLRAQNRDHRDDIPVTMSATSYPGQEWNPYGSGGWEDDEEDLGKARN